MKRIIYITCTNFTQLTLAIAILGLGGCRPCTTCTLETDEGPWPSKICGKKKETAPLINHLESTGWVCE